MKLFFLRLIRAGLQRKKSQQKKPRNLREALSIINKVFGCQRLLDDFGADITIPYYTQSELGYRLFHSSGDAVHMALNFDGSFHTDGYLGQPKMVASLIESYEARNILEVGCGKGFNSLHLARQFPEAQFEGVDLTPAHVNIAARNAAELNNLRFHVGDFHQLALPSGRYDLVFACETLCHARQSDKVLAEMARLLRPGGRLVIFDGYRHYGPGTIDDQMQKAVRLVEVGMAVQHGFAHLDQWLATASGQGLSLETQKNLTASIQPTLNRLQSGSISFFQSPWLSRLLSFLLPKYLLRNSVSGLLMPFCFDVDNGAFGYYSLVLRKG